ncbi:MAG TPA: caspase family protein [Allosphingosinicella sp.]
MLDPGVHAAPIRCAAIDADNRFVATGSYDRTVRLWNVDDGSLIRTIRLPQGPGNIGKVGAVAMSPDGAVIAAAGWLQWSESNPRERICLFDAATGAMIRSLDVPSVVARLAFSPDGLNLAAVLADGNGLRIFGRGSGWKETSADPSYGHPSYGVAFARDGRLATTSLDGSLRLYAADGKQLELGRARKPLPVDLAFSPDGTKLAVGHASTDVWVFDARTLQPLFAADTDGLDNGDLSTVAWSTDGTTLFAGGEYDDGADWPMVMAVAWGKGGKGPLRAMQASQNTIVSLLPLPDGDLLVAAQDPWLGRLRPNGAPRWVQPSRQIESQYQNDHFALSHDGQTIEFDHKALAAGLTRFDLATLTWTGHPPADGRTTPPVRKGLGVTEWENSYAPKLGDRLLPLDSLELSRSLAVHPDGERFLLGTDWALRAFDSTGAQIWRQAVPSIARAVAISGDGRLAAAAYGDGTMRWHRMADGQEILALFPMIDLRNWVAWTPEGVYAATPAARAVLRWHVNRGSDSAADAVPVWKIAGTHRPDVIPHVLPQLGTPGALALAELAKIRGAVQRATVADVAPGARLYVLAIGISEYGPAARHLKLNYADRDARDFAAALRDSQGDLYSEVHVRELVNERATREDIIRELRAIRDGMSRGSGSDLAMILFSGHGVTVDGGRLFLLPYGVDASSTDSIEDTALSSLHLHEGIASLAQHGRAIVFLDACRSGGATQPLDRSLRAMLAAPNVTIMTSSKPGQASLESARWANGAFTEALLEAFRKADADHDGLITVSDLSSYLAERVAGLTDGAQNTEVEIHFDSRILAAMH